MKKIFLIYHGRFPAELGIAFFTAKMAEAFCNAGMETIVLVPRRLKRTSKTSSEYFGTKDNFKVVFLPVLDLLFIGFLEKITFLISLFSFSISCVLYLLFKANKQDVIISCDTPPLLFASIFFPKTVYEIHNYPKNQKGFYSLLFKRVWKIIATNRWKKEKIMKEFGITEERIIYESNAVDFKSFLPNISTNEARRKLELPEDKFIITYVGMLRTMGMEKGLSTLFSVLKRLPEKFILMLVGGTEGDISFYKKIVDESGLKDRVIFAGFVKNTEVPAYLGASSALIAPFPKNDHYEFYMSPMKIFEYMSSRRPIITTNLNSIKEVLGENSAIYTESGDVDSMVNGLLKIDNNPDFAKEISENARKEIEEHSWDKRAERLIKFLSSSYIRDKFKISLFLLLIFLSVFSIYAIGPQVVGDSVSYVDAILVLETGIEPSGFTPYRIVTTYLGLQSVRAIDILVDNILLSWLVQNSLLYIIMGMFFYSLLCRIIGHSKTAFFGTLFLVTNYAVVVFGLSYLMDMGGWAFYVASLYYSYRYLETKETKWLWISSVLVGIGGLFKEYAFLAYVVIFGLIIFIYWKDWSNMIKKMFITGLLSFTPMLVLNLHIFSVYHYTYIDWFFNQPIYVYNSRILEYIKSFGSLYNFGWFLFLGGAYIFFKRTKEVFQDKNLDKNTIFIWLVLLSSTVVFVWPIVTRVLFITMPAVVIVSSLYIKKIHSKLIFLFPIFVLYVLSTYLMDAFILDFVNLPF